ncbi:MAG: DUF393 domain-containing protein [Pseudomonadota bacterium]
MAHQRLTVFFDGDCPLCQREIGYYQKQQGAEEISWRDVSGSADLDLLPAGLSPCDARRRFHIMTPEGDLFSGAHAFAKLWTALPRFRLAGRIAEKTPFRQIFEIAYRGFLVIRPWMQSGARAFFSAKN